LKKLAVGDLVFIEDYSHRDVCLVVEIITKVNLAKVVNSRTLEIDGWGLDWLERNCEKLECDAVD
jgi:hypothetical protein